MDKDIVSPSTDTNAYAETLFREIEGGKIIVDHFPKQMFISEHLLTVAKPELIRRKDDEITITASNAWAKYEIVNYDARGMTFKIKLVDRS